MAAEPWRLCLAGKSGEGRERPSPRSQHLRGGCGALGSAAELAQVFPVPPPSPRPPVGTAGRQAPAGGKLAGETGRGAARCGAKASAKVTRTSGGHGLFVLGPKEGAKAWRVLPARRAWGNRQILVRKCGYIQFRLSEGLTLGVGGTWASLGWYTLSPKSCPHPLRSRIGKMERHASG